MGLTLVGGSLPLSAAANSCNKLQYQQSLNAVLAQPRGCRSFRQLQHRHRGCVRTAVPVTSQLQVPPTLPQRAYLEYPPSRSVPEVSPSSQNDSFETIPGMWQVLAQRHGDQLAVADPHQLPATKLTYRELHSHMTLFAAGLRALGVQAGDKVSLFSENSCRWLVADQAVMMLGAADAVRGSMTPAKELAYIMDHSHSSALIVQDSQTLERMLPALAASGQLTGARNGNGNGMEVHGASSGVRFVVMLWGEASELCRSSISVPTLSFSEVLQQGHHSADTFAPATPSPSDLATLVYTSGTTGNPKGVMLTHANLMYQLLQFPTVIGLRAGAPSLGLLPPWHIYERSCGYYIFSRGCTETYSSIKKFRDDLTKYPPAYFVCVPLVLHTLHAKVLATIKRGSAMKRRIAAAFFAVSAAYVQARRVVNGVSLKYATQPVPIWAYLFAAVTAAMLHPLHRLAAKLVYAKIRTALGISEAVISGGASLPTHLDEFYEIIGLTVLHGWGLTETSPVLTCRRQGDPAGNVRGTVGLPLPGTELRVVDPETLQEVPDGQQGLILACGPGVMRGYYDNEAATAKAFPIGDGWFDTGDLGWRVPQGITGSKMAGSIVLTGRAKDTIVLSTGENVEPQPVEDALQCSPYIKHCIVLGQDRRQLGALVCPDEEALAELAASQGKNELSSQEVNDLIRLEAARLTLKRTHQDRVHHVAIASKPFSIEDGTMTRTMKPRRPVIYQSYAAEIEQLSAKLR